MESLTGPFALMAGQAHYYPIRHFCDKGGIDLSRLSIETPGRAQMVLSGLNRDMERRLDASQPGLCPVDMSLNFLRLCHAQTCGKCVPCRVGLNQLAVLIERVLDRAAALEDIDLIEDTAQVIADSADCAIGYEAAHGRTTRSMSSMAGVSAG